MDIDRAISLAGQIHSLYGEIMNSLTALKGLPVSYTSPSGETVTVYASLPPEKAVELIDAVKSRLKELEKVIDDIEEALEEETGEGEEGE